MLLRTVRGVHARFGLVLKPQAFSQYIARYKHNWAAKAGISAVPLRPYQEEAVKACLDALKQGDTRMGVSMPPGSGKTLVFVELLHRLRLQGNALIIVNSSELARQNAKMIEKMYPNTRVEIEQGENQASGDADITVATIRSLRDRLDKYPLGSIKAIVVDEAHHAVGESYLSILSRFDPGIRESRTAIGRSSVPIFGFSGTLKGPNGISLVPFLQNIVWHRELLQMIEDGHLCDLKFTIVKADIDPGLIKVHRMTEDFTPTSLAKVMNTSVMNKLVVQSWERTAGERKRTLVFCTNVEHLHKLTKAFCKRGYDARYFDGSVSLEERQELLDGFDAGRFPLLLSCGLLAEGIDMPKVDCIVQARPTKSRKFLVQMIGRGTRPSPETGKRDCHILEFIGSGGPFSGVYSAPSIFGLDPNDLEPDAGLLASVKEARAKSPEKFLFTDASLYDDRFSNDDSVSVRNPYVEQERRVMDVSPLAWVACNRKYILRIMELGQMELIDTHSTKNPDKSWRVIFIPLKRDGETFNSNEPPHDVVSNVSLLDAVKAADEYVKEVYPYEWEEVLLRTSGWRSLRITQDQQDQLEKALGISQQHADPGLSPAREWCNIHTSADVTSLRRGQAADLIIRLETEFKGIFGS